MGKIYRYHYAHVEYFKMDIEAESLEEAIEKLEYAGVDCMTNDFSDFLDENDISIEDLDYGNEQQWEQIEENQDILP